MIKKVIATNYLGESLEMELARPEVSGLAITNIEGLGPVKATINTSEIATGDGALYNSAKLETRNIVMTLDFRFGTDIESIRHTTYKYFPIKRYITLTFVTDQRSLDAFGYVASNEPEIFNAHEVAQISVIIPVYNGEKFIKRCHDSLAAQTFEDFEMIFVDDGSKDKSLSILNKLKEKEMRFAVTRDRREWW